MRLGIVGLGLIPGDEFGMCMDNERFYAMRIEHFLFDFMNDFWWDYAGGERDWEMAKWIMDPGFSRMDFITSPWESIASHQHDYKV